MSDFELNRAIRILAEERDEANARRDALSQSYDAKCAEVRQLREDVERLITIAHGLHIRRGFDDGHPIVVDLADRLRSLGARYGAARPEKP